MSGLKGETIEPATLIAAEPQLLVSDVKTACDYYTGKLGFELHFVHGEAAFYAQVGRGGARLNLRRVEGPIFDPTLKERERDLLAASITVDDIDPLLAEFEARGAFIHPQPRTEPWGSRTFIVADPDGNLILFASAPQSEGSRPG